MNPFTEDYFLRGKEMGISNYFEYSWKGDVTISSCRKVMHYLGARPYDSLLEIGTARGYAVKAFRILGLRAYGFDVSEWAISHCDPDVREFVSNEFPKRPFEWAFAKDLAEHVDPKDLFTMLGSLNDTITKGMLFIVPLTEKTGGRYVRDEDEADVTHINRWTFDNWITFFEDAAPSFNINASFNIHGIKPAAAQVPRSCGFFTLIRP